MHRPLDDAFARILGRAASLLVRSAALMLCDVCHAIFALFWGNDFGDVFGMQDSLGHASWPVMSNAALILQFSPIHFLLLSRRGRASFLPHMAKH
jgi:hypothetical protein